MPENKKFWKFCNQAGNKVELLLYGDISQTSWWGDEVTPKQFAEELAGLGALDEITVRINSGGGDVFAAQTIGNLLEQHPANVVARIDGLIDMIWADCGYTTPVVLVGQHAEAIAALMTHAVTVDQTLALRGLLELYAANTRR